MCIRDRDWDESKSDYPPEAVFELFVKNMADARSNREPGKTIGNIAVRTNYEIPGTGSLFKSTGRKVRNITEGPYKEALFELNKKWENPNLWRTLKRISKDYTPGFYVAALDRQYNSDGEIELKSDENRIYVKIFGRTMWLSFLITFICLVLAFPIAYLMSCLLYTSPSPRDRTRSRMPSSA